MRTDPSIITSPDRANVFLRLIMSASSKGEQCQLQYSI